MYENLFSLEGRVALITGASRGIGRAVARGLAEAGADVVMTARSEKDLELAANEIRGAVTGRVEYYPVDMSNLSLIHISEPTRPY